MHLDSKNVEQIRSINVTAPDELKDIFTGVISNNSRVDHSNVNDVFFNKSVPTVLDGHLKGCSHYL